MLLRLTVMVLGLSVLLGCATEHPPEYYKPPPPVALQDPPPGLSVVYLIRTPLDRETVVVHVTGLEPFSLPPETHTVLLLKPGAYGMQGPLSGLVTDSGQSFAPAQLQTHAGQRLILCLSGTVGRSVPLPSMISLADGRLVPSPTTAMMIDATKRFWNNCSEQETQVLLQNARYVRAD